MGDASPYKRGMLTEALARVHTYYVPAQRRVFGEAAAELAALLERIWRAPSAPHPPDFTDGVSAWLDRDGAPHLAVLRGRVVDFPTRGDWLDEVARALHPHAAHSAAAA